MTCGPDVLRLVIDSFTGATERHIEVLRPSAHRCVSRPADAPRRSATGWRCSSCSRAGAPRPSSRAARACRS
jgi:hypothetical protein